MLARPWRTLIDAKGFTLALPRPAPLRGAYVATERAA